MAAPDLTGRKVLAIVTNYGVEQDELVVPVEHLRAAGATVDVAAETAEPIETLVGDKDPGATVTPDTTLDVVDTSGYDLLLIPGGTLNADSLRLSDDALTIVTDFTSEGRPVAAICHGPWALATADAVRGKAMTSYASLETDLRNAGADWSDQAVVTDETSYPLVTSRTPDDLDEFLAAIDAVLTD